MFDHKLRERGRAFGTIRSRALTINENVQDGVVVTLSDVIGSAAAIQKSLDLYVRKKFEKQKRIKIYLLALKTDHKFQNEDLQEL